MLSKLAFTLILFLSLSVRPIAADSTEDDCSTWYSTACWAHLFQNAIDTARDVSLEMKRHADTMLAGVYRTHQNFNTVVDHAEEVLKRASEALIATQQQMCEDDDLFFVEAVAVIAAAIVAVELTMSGGTSGGSGAVALKALLIAQAPKLMSKLHERICGSAFATDDPSLITQVETAIEKALSDK